MREAAERLKDELVRIPAHDMAVPVVCNVDAVPEQDKRAIPDKLYRQMFSPVLWERCVKEMAKGGVEVFLEVGPQKVLSNLIKRIEPDIPCYNVEEFGDMETLKGVLA